ncbi:hypothetical protein [Alkalibacterium thalassium]|uniref:Uncharacterized protein n=1 Tax=Alkalibacterium thalassium TaxID=426701 RepID=A0A1G9E5N1_9LACT|nr:hypothetical protein [Alkalibacterium thalassium]SDK71419.1 hypothetical protein SAMN04488098_105412 [Alkalibacterium thalassium]
MSKSNNSKETGCALLFKVVLGFIFVLGFITEPGLFFFIGLATIALIIILGIESSDSRSTSNNKSSTKTTDKGKVLNGGIDQSHLPKSNRAKSSRPKRYSNYTTQVWDANEINTEHYDNIETEYNKKHTVPAWGNIEDTPLIISKNRISNKEYKRELYIIKQENTNEIQFYNFIEKIMKEFDIKLKPAIMADVKSYGQLDTIHTIDELALYCAMLQDTITDIFMTIRTGISSYNGNKYLTTSYLNSLFPSFQHVTHKYQMNRENSKIINFHKQNLVRFARNKDYLFDNIYFERLLTLFLKIDKTARYIGKHRKTIVNSGMIEIDLNNLTWVSFNNVSAELVMAEVIHNGNLTTENRELKKEINKKIWYERRIDIINSVVTSKLIEATEKIKDNLGDVSNNFYVSSYVCPDCGSQMYKTVFPPGKEYRITVHKKDKTVTGNSKKEIEFLIKRLFTCHQCKTLFTAKFNSLSDGFVYESKTLSSSDYVKEIIKINKVGTTEGRSDSNNGPVEYKSKPIKPTNGLDTFTVKFHLTNVNSKNIETTKLDTPIYGSRRYSSKDDDNAIEIRNTYGRSLGWVPKSHSGKIAKAMDMRQPIFTRISKKYGEKRYGYGLEIIMTTNQETYDSVVPIDDTSTHFESNIISNKGKTITNVDKTSEGNRKVTSSNISMDAKGSPTDSGALHRDNHITKKIKLTGVTFNNRQTTLKLTNKDALITYRRDYYNEFDKNAIEIVDIYGSSLGWVPKSENTELAKEIDKGRKFHVGISQKYGGNNYNYGLEVVMSTDEEVVKSVTSVDKSRTYSSGEDNTQKLRVSKNVNNANDSDLPSELKDEIMNNVQVEVSSETHNENIKDNLEYTSNKLKEASIYLEKTSAKENFIRFVPYYYYLVLRNEDFKNIIVIFYLASIFGPFSFEVFDKQEVKELLELKKYEDDYDFMQKLDDWAVPDRKDYINFEYNIKIWNNILSKMEELISYLNNHQFVEDRAYYLPELEFMGFSKEHWPRI